MKFLFTTAAALVIQLFVGLVPLHAEPLGKPEVDAATALRMASDSLTSRGLDKQVYIASVSLEKTAVFEKGRYWSIRWSEPIQRPGTREREVGAKVTMSGKLVILLDV